MLHEKFIYGKDHFSCWRERNFAQITRTSGNNFNQISALLFGNTSFPGIHAPMIFNYIHIHVNPKIPLSTTLQYDGRFEQTPRGFEL